MEKLVQRNPKNALAHLDRSSHLATTGAPEEAIKEALKSLELKSDNRPALSLVTRCYLVTRDFKKGREYAALGIKLYPDSAAMYMSMANVEAAARDYDKAIAVVRQGLQATGRNPQLLWSLASRLIDANNLPEAQKTIEELRTFDYGRRQQGQAEQLNYKPLVEYLDARIEMAQGHWLAACQGFQKSRREVSTPEGVDLRKLVDMSIAVCYGHLGSLDQQIEALRRTVKADPNMAFARRGLAEALLAAGNVDEAQREFRELERRGSLNAGDLISLARLRIFEIARKPAGQRDWRAVEELVARPKRLLCRTLCRSPSCRAVTPGARPLRRRGFVAAESPQQGPRPGRTLEIAARAGREPEGLGQGRATPGGIAKGIGRHRGAAAAPDTLPRAARGLEG